MASKGDFPDGDPTPLVDLVAKKILKGSALGAMLGKIGGVHVWPAGVKRRHRDQVPTVYIGRPTIRRRHVSVAVTAPGADAATIQYWLAAAGVAGVPLEESWGITSAQFPEDVSADAVVHWALAALKAVGASPAAGWHYEGEKPDNN